MTNEIADIFLSKKILLRNLSEFDLSKITKIRSYKAFIGVDKSGFFVSVFLRRAKSRFVMKDAIALEGMIEKIQQLRNHSIKKRVLFCGPICSKSISYLDKLGWRVYDTL